MIHGKALHSGPKWAAGRCSHQELSWTEKNMTVVKDKNLPDATGYLLLVEPSAKPAEGGVFGRCEMSLCLENHRRLGSDWRVLENLGGGAEAGDAFARMTRNFNQSRARSTLQLQALRKCLYARSC